MAMYNAPGRDIVDAFITLHVHRCCLAGRLTDSVNAWMMDGIYRA